MPEMPADHRSTELAQIFFAGLLSFIDSDLHVPVVRAAWRSVPRIPGGSIRSGWSHTDCPLVSLEKAGTGQLSGDR